MRRKAISLADGEYLIPPCDGVAVTEYADQVRLSPTYWCREFVGLGRFDQGELFPWLKPKRKWWWPWGEREEAKPALAPQGDLHPLFYEALGKKPWVVVWWEIFDDGQASILQTHMLDSQCSKERAETEFQKMVNFTHMTKAEFEAIGKCFKQKPEDIAFIQNRFPEGMPDPSNVEEYDLYQARLKVLAGMQPKTVSLMELANEASQPSEREGYQREAVSAYFAELARFWSEDQLRGWQRSNPVGSEWMREYARVLDNPTKKLDPVNHVLVLNWLRKGLNLLTAEELAGVIFKTTGYRVSAQTIKKRRERLGLTTKRPTGPRPNVEL